jgi:hypothetical protein
VCLLQLLQKGRSRCSLSEHCLCLDLCGSYRPTTQQPFQGLRRHPHVRTTRLCTQRCTCTQRAKPCSSTHLGGQLSVAAAEVIQVQVWQTLNCLISANAANLSACQCNVINILPGFSSALSEIICRCQTKTYWRVLFWSTRFSEAKAPRDDVGRQQH